MGSKLVFLSFFLFGLIALSQSPTDFSTYRLGGNNRNLFEAILKDLQSEFGHPVTSAYGEGLQAKVDRIVIDEAQMDAYLKETKDPTEREALARFMIAHEYFHVLLKHPQTDERGRAPKEIEIRGSFSEARRQMENQVDYLASKYLKKLKLPIEPIRSMFLSHPEFHGGDYYPKAEERAEIVASAQRDEFQEEIFDHKAIKCVFLLGSLASKLP